MKITEEGAHVIIRTCKVCARDKILARSVFRRHPVEEESGRRTEESTRIGA